MFSPNGIQAVLFDLDGTLRHNRPLSTDIFLDKAVQLGAQDSPELRREAIRWTHYYWAQSPELLADRRLFVEENHEFWLNYAHRHLEAFGCQPNMVRRLAPEIHSYMRSCYQPEDWVPPGTHDALQAMQQAGFRLGLLTNRTQPCDEQLAALGLAGYFEVVLTAGEVGWWKPDPQIFWHALERMGLEPHQAMYIGDSYYADVLGARNAGLLPVLIDPLGLFPEAGCRVIQSIDDLIVPGAEFESQGSNACEDNH